MGKEKLYNIVAFVYDNSNKEILQVEKIKSNGLMLGKYEKY